MTQQQQQHNGRPRYTPPTLPRMAALYARVSSKHQAEDDKTSLQTQLAALQAKAAALGYATAPDFCYSDAFSGEELHQRPALSRLREDARAPRFGLVLAYNVYALAKNQAHMAILLDEWERLGIGLQFVTEELEDTPLGRMILSARTFAAEVEGERRKVRMHRATHARAQDGQFIPGIRPLYGYQWGPERYADGARAGKLRKMRLIPDETTAPIVRRVYQEAHAGVSLRRIAAGLTADGIPTPTGRVVWDANTVRWILWHPTYWGEPAALRWQSEEVPKAVRDQYKHKSRQVRRPAEQQIALAPTAAPPLVAPELAGAVHARLREQQVLGTGNQHNHYPEAALLRGHAFCADCEHALAAWTTAGSRGSAILRTRYQCRYATRANAAGVRCTPVHSIEAHKLDAAVWTTLVAVLRNPRLIEQEVARMRETDTQGKQPGADTLESIDRQVADLRRRIENKRKYAEAVDDDIERREVAAEVTLLRKQEHGLEAERVATLAHFADWREQQADLEQTIDLLGARVGQHLDTLLYEEKRGVLRALRVRVLLHRADARPRVELLLHLPLSGRIVLDLLEALEGSAEPALAVGGSIALVQKNLGM